jgi:Trypsin-co-occurring domain 1
MPVFQTELEGDRLILLEAEPSADFNKSELEVRPSPMLAFERSMAAIGEIGRTLSARVRHELDGTGAETAEVTFGVKIDGAGSVMIAQESARSQFAVKIVVRVG